MVKPFSYNCFENWKRWKDFILYNIILSLLKFSVLLLFKTKYFVTVFPYNSYYDNILPEWGPFTGALLLFVLSCFIIFLSPPPSPLSLSTSDYITPSLFRVTWCGQRILWFVSYVSRKKTKESKCYVIREQFWWVKRGRK